MQHLVRVHSACDPHARPCRRGHMHTVCQCMWSLRYCRRVAPSSGHELPFPRCAKCSRRRDQSPSRVNANRHQQKTITQRPDGAKIRRLNQISPNNFFLPGSQVRLIHVYLYMYCGGRFDASHFFLMRRNIPINLCTFGFAADRRQERPLSTLCSYRRR